MSVPLPASVPKPISEFAVKKTCFQFQRRRLVFYGLIGAGMGLSASSDEASAAKRRPPPPPPTEKKDLNVSGVQAKVLASKKRKEEFKEEIARLRERGKTN
ncbi:uncharacterized protein LOC110111810 [Dendrobium catenatum]|uniref:Uncharacterized protein n=1 Tax=Dendrobium catenatum TaxID=906689 RepID=A0A2I0WSP7_9ASPA|nr:uncharacterized protein LOC110111810 [Dendrobium catenatum]PKU78673.1 hypothetical protein MA16_Dca000016 [Dendrobium catenatum]